ncbi:CoA transferase [Aeromicrobium sp. YIM 150415]|uniref:CoA transferase n=1 Tax=Aeromicrobium sp. YIM 150415 TaxID=2803912 RepID=UPI0019669753|nr:CoA transferase [Aeromicrobium sp. YIM 150415]MBM9463577.1 CoA transferase [Aeromicrobium sp. YIM 150415]
MTIEGATRLTVIDAGSLLATALFAKTFRELGATVVRAEPEPQAPITQRHPFIEGWEPWNRAAPVDDLDALAATADVLIIGSESRVWNAEAFREAHPSLIVVDIGGWPGDPDFPAIELLVQARSGIAFEQHPDRPVLHGQQPGMYGAAILALCGAWAAILQRRTSGRGQTVRTSLLEGLALTFPSLWMDAEKPDAKFNLVQPRGVQNMVFPCADGRWIQLVLGTRGALPRLLTALGIEADIDSDHSGAPDPHGGLRNYYGPYDLIAEGVARYDRQTLVQRLRDAEVGVELVTEPGESWDDAQVRCAEIITPTGQGGRRVGLPLTVRPTDSTARPADTTTQHGDDARAAGGPLSGVRVVDFGNFVAGPMTSRILHDLGADVIWVEPVANPRPVSTFRTILVSNRGKRSLRADLKSPEGLAIVRTLSATADVATHNFRVGVAQRLGISPADLRQANPAIVTLQTSGYGQHGPRSTATGFDPIFQSFSGLAGRASGPQNPPELCRSTIVDYCTAGLGALSVLIALNERAETSRAQETEVDLLRTSLFLLCDVIEDAAGTRRGAFTLNPEQTGFEVAERIWRTQDGWIAVSARSEAQRHRFISALGLPKNADLSASAGTAEALALEISGQKTVEILDRLTDVEVWAAAVSETGWSGMRDDPGARASGLVTAVEDQRYGRVGGWFGSLIRLSSWRDESEQRSVPRPGEHTVEILESLGLDHAEVDRLITRRAVAGDDSGW